MEEPLLFAQEFNRDAGFLTMTLSESVPSPLFSPRTTKYFQNVSDWASKPWMIYDGNFSSCVIEKDVCKLEA